MELFYCLLGAAIGTSITIVCGRVFERIENRHTIYGRFTMRSDGEGSVGDITIPEQRMNPYRRIEKIRTIVLIRDYD